MASVTCRLRQWGPYTSTRTLAPSLGSKERLRNRHGVIRRKLNTSVLSLLPEPPSFSRASIFSTFEKCRSDALIPGYTRYHWKHFHDHWIGSKCYHFGYLVHCHSPCGSRDPLVSIFTTSPGIQSVLFVLFRVPYFSECINCAIQSATLFRVYLRYSECHTITI